MSPLGCVCVCGGGSERECQPAMGTKADWSWTGHFPPHFCFSPEVLPGPFRRSNIAPASLPCTRFSPPQVLLECPVCLLEFEEDQVVWKMPCQHLFQRDCILPRLGKTSLCPFAAMTCPLMMSTTKHTRRTNCCDHSSKMVRSDIQAPADCRSGQVQADRNSSLMERERQDEGEG
uniref:RING-type domain-containing protein n=1 Tax=Salvator merianae TaxID=96440 RepID=A0A8D0E9S1_SALMN